MMKYSLTLLTVAAVSLSVVGCDGECCGSTTGPIASISSALLLSGSLDGAGSSDRNSDGSIVAYAWKVDGVSVANPDTYTFSSGTHEVCLTVTDNDGLKDETCENVTIGGPRAIITLLPKTCTPGETLNVSGSTSAGSPSAYAWTPTSIAASASGTINCPAAGVAQEVCLTVTDSAGATDKTCKTVTGESSSDTCPTELKITVDGDEDFSAFAYSADQDSQVDYNVSTNLVNCPDVTCEWTVHSFIYDDSDTVTTQFDCIAGEFIASDGNRSGNESTHVTFDGTKKLSFTPSICSSAYSNIEVNATCIRAGVEYTDFKTYTISR